MKLEPRTFRVFWDVHAWAGVVSALLWYVMFFAAAFALFHPELDDWAQPRGNVVTGGAPRLQPRFEQLRREERLGPDANVGFMTHEPAVNAYIWGGEAMIAATTTSTPLASARSG